ncbi:type VI lipase adapter Tla3 domain-containing protein, partial [Massilia glaciei]
MSNRILWWVAGPVAAVALLLGGRWMVVSNNAQAKELHVQAAQSREVAATEQSKREYVLEVIGLGVTLDKYRQGKLWEALQKGSPFVTIREQDKEKYPWSGQDKAGTAGGRGGDTLENGAQYTPMYYGVPVFNAAAPSADPAMADKPDEPNAGLAGSAVSSGMAWHLFVVGPRLFDERPDRILEQVFAFFDANPDVPYVVLNTYDGMEPRNSNRMPGTPELLTDGQYIPEMPDASALFVLARRERIDAVRPFVWDDPDNEFSQNVFRSMYCHLLAAVPHPERKKIIRTPAQVGADPIRHDDLDDVQRQPLVSEWLEATAAFVQRPDIRGTGAVSMLNHINPFAHRPPTNWKPTPWFPIPWSTDQLATFDRLPTLGFIHRPTFVKFTDEHGKPLTRRDERNKAMQAGWQAAL